MELAVRLIACILRPITPRTVDGLRLTPTEAGFVTDRSRAAVNRAVDEGVIRADVRRVGRRKDRLIGRPELRYLRIAETMS